MNRTNFLLFLGIVTLISGTVFWWLSDESLEPVSLEDNTLKAPEILAVVWEENQGCYSCHGNMLELEGTHAQAGCISCHLGNGTELTLEKAHEGLVSVPGNFSDMHQTCGKCHAESVHHVINSIMATNSGLVNVDRYIFGERDSPDGYSDVKEIGHTAADKHLRMLCARCHLGNEKTKVGPVTELSRGGGCTACHSNYSDNARKNHHHLKKGKIDSLAHHPMVDVQVSSDHCFGCHSRSGRISTNYEGWHETMFREGDSIPTDGEFRLLEDGRYFTKMEEDVHHELGLQCIDCHVYSGVMGDGKQYMHEEDAVKISCEDCHFSNDAKTKKWEELNAREKRVYGYRGYSHSEMLMVAKDSSAILNSYLNEKQQPILKSKFTDAEFLLSEPSEMCSRSHGHQDITCSACHTSWAPQCAGCHVEYDPNKRGYDLFEGKWVTGTWVESAGGFFAGLPSLGVYRNGETKSITSAIPGMIMSLDASGFHGKQSPEKFFRLFAPAKPHTTGKSGRSCTSCHNDPVALGYGRGELAYVTASPTPHWEFVPEYQNLKDGLPSDAWIPFLGERKDMVSTRLNYSPFTIEEQQRILTVGACLTCHSSSSPLMQKSIHMDFSVVLNSMRPQCKKPAF